MKYVSRLVIIGVSCGVVVGLWFAWSAPDSAELNPFEGELAHDFGTLRFDGAIATESHTFTLTNRTDKMIRIIGNGSTCGCTLGQVSKDVVAPGEDVEVKATLSMQKAGRKNAKVWLALEDGGRVVMGITGAAVRIQQVYAMQSSVVFDDDGSVQILLVATDLISDAQPPVPTIDAPDGIAAVFHGWQLILPRVESNDFPARWHGRVDVQRTLGNGTLSEQLHIAIDDKHSVEINLDGRRRWRSG